MAGNDGVRPEASPPAEVFAHILQRHQPLPTGGNGFACSCGKWKAPAWSRDAFDGHRAEVLANLSPDADANGTEWLRHGYFERNEDVSGVSGPGRVAEFFVHGNKHVSLTWLVPPYGDTWYQSIDDMKEVHGHDGRTQLVNAIDEQPMTMKERDEMAHRSRGGA